MTMTLDSYLTTKSQQIQERLDKLIPARDGPYRQIFEATRYSLLAGGKRIRPILTIAVAEAFGVPLELSIDAACALEMIHTSSLIHDDLPCMDDDDLRRGKPTLHKVFPEAYAVLAGDYLLTFTFELLSTLTHLSVEQRLELIYILAHRSGSEGLIGGQIMDIEAEGKTISPEALEMIHQYKTGAMFSASVEFAGVIANVSEGEMEILKNFASAIGLAFQIVDDILDVTASDEVLGKTAGSDVAKNKSTYISLKGLEQSRLEAEQLYHQAIASLDKLDVDTTILREIANIIVVRSR